MHFIKDSVENYLETILVLSKNNNMVRAVDIAAYWDISKPSVSNAMKNLREQGLILVEENGNILLTEKGNSQAKEVLERHSKIKDFLIYIGVDPATAEEDACKMEHVFSEESFQKFKSYCHWITENNKPYSDEIEKQK
ncbi:MAG: metal-dependent transcriptional regulator [Gallicola sp.]|nr:metal-dependent transcriptional regulator [Gallicola sp.]